jgi:hypothetical protein
MRLVDALVVVRVTISEGREGRRRGGEQQPGVEDEGRGGGSRSRRMIFFCESIGPLRELARVIAEFLGGRVGSGEAWRGAAAGLRRT